MKNKICSIGLRLTLVLIFFTVALFGCEQFDTPTPNPLPPGPAQPNLLQVTYFDVGQGDAILLRTPDGQTMLIDGGETDTGIVGDLQALNIQRIDVMVATHPHSDHIGGLVQVLKAIPVTKVVTNGQPHTTSTYEHFLDAITSAKAEYVEAKRGDTITLGSLSFAVLSPTATTGDMNHNSLVLRLVYGNGSFLFMGDADKDAEASMLSAGLTLQAAILKVGHHASSSASSKAFLNQVKPKVAIYTAALGNSYGHPHAVTLTALAAVGAQIYGTDVNGTITVTTDGVTYQVSTQKGGPR
jgi:competence protein ComEC